MTAINRDKIFSSHKTIPSVSLHVDQLNRLSEEPFEICGPRLEMDCERRIANEKFTFYQPLYLGDFLMCCWAKCAMPGVGAVVTDATFDGTQPNIYGVAIYENGLIVDPTKDRRFHRNGRAWPTGGLSWADSRFTRMELTELIQHVKRLIDGNQKMNKRK